MSDLWTEASRDIDAETLNMAVTSARVGVQPVWEFLAGATTDADFEHRKAIIAEHLDAAVDTAVGERTDLSDRVRTAVLAALDSEFTQIKAQRLAAREPEVRARIEATLREAEGGDTPFVSEADRSTEAPVHTAAEGDERAARVKSKNTTLAQVQNYMPSNYHASQDPDGTIWISGRDSAGWTLDGYVIPRLASGLIFAEEVSGEGQGQTWASHTGAADSPMPTGKDSIFCGRCKGTGMVNMGGAIRNCTKCKGSGLKPGPRKTVQDAVGREGALHTALTLGDLEERPYEATCPNPSCPNHGTAFVHDDFSSTNENDDDEAVCPDCETPLAWENRKSSTLQADAAKDHEHPGEGQWTDEDVRRHLHNVHRVKERGLYGTNLAGLNSRELNEVHRRDHSKTSVLHTAPGGGEHAPYRIEPKDKGASGPFKVVNDLGEVKSTFDSWEKAREYQKALYANVPGASESAEKEHKASLLDLATAAVAQAIHIEGRENPSCPRCGSKAVMYSKFPLDSMDGHTSHCRACNLLFNQEHAYAPGSYDKANPTERKRASLEAEAAEEHWLDKARRISSGAGKGIYSERIDHVTAGMLTQVHDALSPENQAKFKAMPLHKAVDVGWKVVNRSKKGAYNPFNDPNNPYVNPKKPTAEERRWREHFPEGVPLHGDLTPEQERELKRRGGLESDDPAGWYIMEDGKESGPFTDDEKAQMDSGNRHPYTWVHHGMFRGAQRVVLGHEDVQPHGAHDDSGKHGDGSPGGAPAGVPPAAPGEQPPPDQPPAGGGELQVGSQVTVHFVMPDGTKGECPATVQSADANQATLTYENGTFSVTKQGEGWADTQGATFTFDAGGEDKPKEEGGEGGDDKQKPPWAKDSPAKPSDPKKSSLHTAVADGDQSFCRICGRELEAQDNIWYALKASPPKRDVPKHHCLPARMPGANWPGEFNAEGELVPGEPKDGGIYDAGANLIHVSTLHVATDPEDAADFARETAQYAEAAHKAYADYLADCRADAAVPDPYPVWEERWADEGAIASNPFESALEVEADYDDQDWDGHEASAITNPYTQSGNPYSTGSPPSRSGPPSSGQGQDQNAYMTPEPTTTPMTTKPRSAPGGGGQGAAPPPQPRTNPNGGSQVSQGFASLQAEGYGYAGDPHWITAQHPGVCASGDCHNEIKPGDRVFFYPHGRKAYCAEHSDSVARRAESEMWDEDVNQSAHVM